MTKVEIIKQKECIVCDYCGKTFELAGEFGYFHAIHQLDDHISEDHILNKGFDGVIFKSDRIEAFNMEPDRSKSENLCTTVIERRGKALYFTGYGNKNGDDSQTIVSPENAKKIADQIIKMSDELIHEQFLAKKDKTKNEPKDL